MTNKISPIYEVGTLRYTMPKLLFVCALVILAILSLNLLAYKMVPTLMPILLDNRNVSSTNIALILGTLPAAMNFFICPFISTLSDKTRTRWGRRIPYLALSTPFVVIFMVLIAFEPNITSLLCGITGFSFNTVGFAVLAILTVLFQLAYLVPGAIIYYIYADVIPKKFIGTFMGVMTFLCTGVTFVFNYFILQPAVDNPRLWFPLIGGVYLTAFTLLCLLVREGKYPEVDDKIDKKESLVEKAKDYVSLYFRECYSHRIFVMLFVTTGLTQASTICRNVFNLLFATKEIGMTAGEYGKVIAWGALVGAVCVLPMGKIMDKVHPIRVFLFSGLIVVAANAWGFFFVYDAKSFTVVGIAISLIYAVQMLSTIPLLIALVPQEKFGQFASANSMLNCLVMLFASWLGGYCTELFGYRVIFVWDFILTLIATGSLLVVYYDWKGFGGQKNYIPPNVDEKITSCTTGNTI